MIFFAAQLHRFSISVSGDRIITLSSYDKFAEEISKITNAGMGKEYIVVMIPTDSPESEEFRNESPEETKERFQKRMHALITELAELEGATPEEMKKVLKKEWIDEGIIMKSTTELTIPGYAERITCLIEKIHAKKNNN